MDLFQGSGPTGVRPPVLAQALNLTAWQMIKSGVSLSKLQQPNGDLWTTIMRDDTNFFLYLNYVDRLTGFGVFMEAKHGHVTKAMLAAVVPIFLREAKTPPPCSDERCRDPASDHIPYHVGRDQTVGGEVWCHKYFPSLFRFLNSVRKGHVPTNVAWFTARGDSRMPKGDWRVVEVRWSYTYDDWDTMSTEPRVGAQLTVDAVRQALFSLPRTGQLWGTDNIDQRLPPCDTVMLSQPQHFAFDSQSPALNAVPAPAISVRSLLSAADTSLAYGGWVGSSELPPDLLLTPDDGQPAASRFVGRDFYRVPMAEAQPPFVVNNFATGLAVVTVQGTAGATVRLWLAPVNVHCALTSKTYVTNADPTYNALLEHAVTVELTTGGSHTLPPMYFSIAAQSDYRAVLRLSVFRDKEAPPNCFSNAPEFVRLNEGFSCAHGTSSSSSSSSSSRGGGRRGGDSNGGGGGGSSSGSNGGGSNSGRRSGICISGTVSSRISGNGGGGDRHPFNSSTKARVLAAVPLDLNDISVSGPSGPRVQTRHDLLVSWFGKALDALGACPLDCLLHLFGLEAPSRPGASNCILVAAGALRVTTAGCYLAFLAHDTYAEEPVREYVFMKSVVGVDVHAQTVRKLDARVVRGLGAKSPGERLVSLPHLHPLYTYFSTEQADGPDAQGWLWAKSLLRGAVVDPAVVDLVGYVALGQMYVSTIACATYVGAGVCRGRDVNFQVVQFDEPRPRLSQADADYTMLALLSAAAGLCLGPDTMDSTHADALRSRLWLRLHCALVDHRQDPDDGCGWLSAFICGLWDLTQTVQAELRQHGGFAGTTLDGDSTWALPIRLFANVDVDVPEFATCLSAVQVNRCGNQQHSHGVTLPWQRRGAPGRTRLACVVR
jgi:hypothetical protein